MEANTKTPGDFGNADPYAAGERLASDAVRSVRDGLDAVGRYVRSATDSAQQRVADYRDGGFERVKDDVVSYTKSNPANALLVAAGIGLLLGILSAMRRD